MIGATLSTLLRYSLGLCHYVKHFKWMGAGVVFGLTYSFFFTSQKAEVFKAKKYLGINDL